MMDGSGTGGDRRTKGSGMTVIEGRLAAVEGEHQKEHAKWRASGDDDDIGQGIRGAQRQQTAQARAAMESRLAGAQAWAVTESRLAATVKWKYEREQVEREGMWQTLGYKITRQMGSPSTARRSRIMARARTLEPGPIHYWAGTTAQARPGNAQYRAQSWAQLGRVSGTRRQPDLSPRYT